MYMSTILYNISVRQWSCDIISLVGEIRGAAVLQANVQEKTLLSYTHHTTLYKSLFELVCRHYVTDFGAYILCYTS